MDGWMNPIRWKPQLLEEHRGEHANLELKELKISRKGCPT
jgi:hypothetical protein